jgi:serine/threonine protein phosphatase PrpC
MIYSYEVKIKGTSHEQDNTPCQDAYFVSECGGDMVIAAVADGLGSCVHSDIAAQVAVEKSVEFCKESLRKDNTEVCDIIRKSFVVAIEAIEDKVREDEGDLSQYLTTLSLGVLLKNTLYYGHAGDSGIIALTHEGKFEKVTEEQQDEDGCVFHLGFLDKWQFDQFKVKVCSVLLATDGVLSFLFPRVLKNEKVNVRVNILREWMDNRLIDIANQGEDTIKSRTEKIISDIPTTEFRNDDITVVVLVNSSGIPETPPDGYYEEPDWKVLYEKLADEIRIASENYYRETTEKYVREGIMKISESGDVEDSENKSPRESAKKTDNKQNFIHRVLKSYKNFQR